MPPGAGAAFRPLVDGSRHGPDRRTPVFILDGLDRGEHVLQVLLVDGKGEVVAASPPVTFHDWRAPARFPGARNSRADAGPLTKLKPRRPGTPKVDDRWRFS
jgi:hypothetical protein